MLTAKSAVPFRRAIAFHVWRRRLARPVAMMLGFAAAGFVVTAYLIR
jgi:hypothetical protein